MATVNDMRIRPDEVGDVTKHLDELADRVQKLMTDESPHLTVVASGHDEVSQRVAHTSNEVHASFAKAAEQGQTEIHEIAATLRAHSGRIEERDLG